MHDVKNLGHCVMPMDDFGYAVKILEDGVYTSSDFHINHFLTHRWKPHKQDEFPISYHNKSGKIRPRSVNNLEQFPWLAISRFEPLEGVWCAQCVLCLKHQMKVVVGVVRPTHVSSYMHTTD